MLLRIGLSIMAVLVTGFTVGMSVPKSSYGIITLISPLASSTVYHTVNDTQTSLSSLSEKISKPTQKSTNILLLGLDGRHGDKNPRCDAIHILSIDPTTQTVLITSIPRATPVTLSTDVQSGYIANYCHNHGVAQTIPLIEKIAGVGIDNVVELGFSQALGVLRTLKVYETPTLQFLRNRAYGRGDYQRSRNQAVFLKDALINYMEQFVNLPKPVKYIAFKTIETSLTFDEADGLLQYLVQMDLSNHPERISLVTKPPPPSGVKEIHVDQTKYAADANWKDDKEFQTYQLQLEQYINNRITQASVLISNGNTNSAAKLITTVLQQQIWLQVDDPTKRNNLHFEILRLYVLSSPNQGVHSSLILDFITEMETLEETKLKEKATDLLNQL